MGNKIRQQTEKDNVYIVNSDEQIFCEPFIWRMANCLLPEFHSLLIQNREQRVTPKDLTKSVQRSWAQLQQQRPKQ